MASAQDIYTARDVERVTLGQVNSGVLRSWIQRGNMPLETTDPGRGRDRQYPKVALYLLAIMAEFRRRGVSPKVAESWTRAFHEAIRQGSQPFYIVWSRDDADAFFVTDPMNLNLDTLAVRMDRPRGFCVICPALVMKQVDAILADGGSA